MCSKSHSEIEAWFESFDQWMQWQQAQPWIHDKTYIKGIVDAVAGCGLVDPEFGLLPASEIAITGHNYRESLVARGLNARQRAVMERLVDVALKRGRDLQVYAPESLTPFAERMRLFFPGFRGSEYLPDQEARSRLPRHLRRTEHQDVCALTFADATFDLYVSSEILEHVPSIDRTLNEARRVLRPGGAMISTFPFNFMSRTSVEKAQFKDGCIVHLSEPEYHGNPADPGKGSLVFTIPGWNILEQCKAAGFGHSAIVFRSSRRLGVIGAETAGIFILIAQV
jgi:SAM-dependent methyltransferase